MAANSLYDITLPIVTNNRSAHTQCNLIFEDQLRVKQKSQLVQCNFKPQHYSRAVSANIQSSKVETRSIGTSSDGFRLLKRDGAVNTDIDVGV